MAIVKNYNKLLDLDEIDVLIDENEKSKHIIITDMPESLPQGRSSFLIETSPFMREGVELQMDFIDSEGASIYTEPVFEYLEGTARRVSIEIYNDTAPGIATLIIVGELEGVPEDNTIFSESDPVPEEYEGVYNVRLTKQIIINPTAVNTQPIKFFAQPQIRVFETQLGTMVRAEITGSITSSLFNVEGAPTDSDLLYKPYGMIEGEAPQGTLSEATSTPPSRRKNIKSFIETRKLKFRKGLRKNSSGKRSGFTAKRNSPAQFPYQLKIGTFDGGETFRFNTKHVGGEVHLHDSDLGNLFADTSYYPDEALSNSGLLETPTFDVLKVPGVTNIAPSHYTASIVDLVNDKTALIELPFTNKNANGENIILPVYGKGEIFFEAMPTGSYAEANLVSYADVRLSNMRTFSGDVFKVKVYVKSEGGFDDFKLLAEVPLEGRELLIDNASVGQGERTGYAIKQEDITTYWDVYGGTDGLYQMPAAAAALSASYSNEALLDSVKISGSLNNNNDHIRFQLKDAYEFDLDPKLDYTLSATVVGERKHGKEASLLFYISGSSMKHKKFLYNYPNTNRDIQEASAYGKRLGSLEVTSADDPKKDFGLLTHNFTPDISGSGVLQFRSIHGEWSISDISITPSDDTGFSPSFFQFSQELPASLSHKRPDKFEFLVEFYDINNNISDTLVYASDILFQGTNMTITGNDNVLESSLFIGGDTIGGGMHLGGVTSTLPETGGDGAVGSGFMRSVGYQGFVSASAQSGSYGFMIYSGSVLPDSGEDYKGVGLELVGVSGSFKFRTSPSVFDVRADAFFVGNPDLQFISGSGSDIEISSSDFHLTPEGNVTASAILLGDKGGGNYLQFVDDTLTVVGDLSVNNLFLPALIGGATSTVLNASSSLSSTGFAKFVSASIGGWSVGTGSIESPGSSLVLDPAGRQFRVSDGSNDRVHIGQVATGEYGMKVFDGTGTADSDILVELGEGGNNIAGWTINADTLQGGNMIIDKAGTIKSANYQKNVAGSGFILTAAEGGYLEVENAKIRGTMATTTFEKESVNAVGGQLYVANSTTLTSSAAHIDGNYPATETTMSVMNVSGFAANEILVLKKITDTGFNTEYVKVISSSINNPGDDNDLTGNLYLARGYSGSTPSGQSSSSLGDSAGNATFYSGSQVIVSTGKIGTGFIRLNANPNDTSTPYMDIVERTGSAIYDTELKVRLGDLSGVAGTRNVPAGFTGFGLMSEVAFLSGSNIKLEAPTFLLGDLNRNFVSGSSGNIQISSSKFHLDSKNELFFVGQPTGSKIEFDGNELIMSSSAFSLGSEASAFVSGSNGNLVLSASNFRVDGGNLMVGSNTGSRLEFSDNQLTVSASKFFIGSVGNSISGSNGTLEISSSNFNLTPSGDVTMKGDVKATAGFMQDITVTGLRVKPKIYQFHNVGSSQTADQLENTSSLEPFSGSIVETWWSDPNLTAMTQSRLIAHPDFPNSGGGAAQVTASLMDNNFTCWGWKFFVNSGSNTDDHWAFGGSAGEWLKKNPLGLEAYYGHRLDGHNFLGIKSLDTGTRIDDINTQFGQHDGYPGPKEKIYWGYTRPAPADNTGTTKLADLVDPDSVFSGYDNYPQSEFTIVGTNANTASVAQSIYSGTTGYSEAAANQLDAGQFSPVFAFYTASGLQASAPAGSTHDTMYYNIVSPMMTREDDGGKNRGPLGDWDQEEAFVEFYTKALTGLAYNQDASGSLVRNGSEVSCKFMIQLLNANGGGFDGIETAYEQTALLVNNPDTSGINKRKRWHKFSAPLSEIVESAGSDGTYNDGFRFVIQYKHTRTNSSWTRAHGGAVQSTHPITGHLKGFALTELRITKGLTVNTAIKSIADVSTVTKMVTPQITGHGTDSLVIGKTGVNTTVSGSITHLEQPCFNVMMDGDQNNLTQNTNVTLLFNDEIYDVGGNFDISTYTFTAPITGKYLLSVNVAMKAAGQTADREAILKIVTSNRTYITIKKQTAGEENHIKYAPVVDMDANDTAYVTLKLENTTGDTVDIEDGTSASTKTLFMGYLLG